MSHGSRTVPEALFLVHGSQLAVQPGAPPGELQRVRDSVRETIAQALYECRGQAVVVFDEMQKAAPGALAALAEVAGGVLHFVERDGLGNRLRTVALDASHAVFIVITDVGEADIQAWMHAVAAEEIAAAESAAQAGEDVADAGGDRSRSVTEGAQSGGINRDAVWSRMRVRLHWQLRRELSDASARYGVDLGAVATAVIPFLPYRQVDAHAILRGLLLPLQATLQRAAVEHEILLRQDPIGASDAGKGRAAPAGAWGHDRSHPSGSPPYALLRFHSDTVAALLSDPSHVAYSWDSDTFTATLEKARQRRSRKARPAIAGPEAGANATAVRLAVDGVASASPAGDSAGHSEARPPAPPESNGGDPYRGLRRKLKDYALVSYGARALQRGGTSSPLSRLVARIDAVAEGLEAAAGRLEPVAAAVAALPGAANRGSAGEEVATHCVGSIDDAAALYRVDTETLDELMQPPRESVERSSQPALLSWLSNTMAQVKAAARSAHASTAKHRPPATTAGQPGADSLESGGLASVPSFVVDAVCKPAAAPPPTGVIVGVHSRASGGDVEYVRRCSGSPGAGLLRIRRCMLQQVPRATAFTACGEDGACCRASAREQAAGPPGGILDAASGRSRETVSQGRGHEDANLVLVEACQTVYEGEL
jgi:hypothetical protein